MTKLAEDKLKKVPITDLTTPRSGQFMVFVNYWWPVTKNNELLFYTHGQRRQPFMSPQCNPDKNIARKVAESYDLETTIIQLAIVYVPHNCD